MKLPYSFKMHYKFHFFLLLYLFSSSVSGQDPYYINYDTKDGLPSSEVHAVEVDPNGMVWFATDRGVCSFNGYEFKTYSTDDGLANNSTLAIWKDRKGNFWFPGLDGSLSIYDHKKFYPYKWNDTLKATIHRPENISWDHEGNLFFWRSKSRLRTKYSIDNNTGKVSQAPFGYLAKKFSVLEMENTRFIDMDGYYLPDDEAYSGPLVIKTDTIIYYNQKVIEDSDLEQVIFKNSAKTNITEYHDLNATILNIKKEKDGSILICTKKGLFRFQKGNFKKVPIRYFHELSITDVAIDFEGNYWLTTLQNGIFKVPSFKFESIRTPLNIYSFENLLSIAKLKHHIIIGSANGSLFVIDDNFIMQKIGTDKIDEQYWFSSTFNNFAYFKGLQILEENHQLHFSKIPTSVISYPGVYKLKNGDFFSVGFFEIRIFSSKFKTLYYPGYTFKKRIESVIEKDNKIWFGTADGLFSIKDRQYHDIINESNENIQFQVRIKDLKLDNHDNLWVSTIGNGIIYKTPDTTYQIAVTNGLNSNLVNQIYVENDSSIWIATNQGLNNLIYNYDEKKLLKKKITSYTTTDGLLSNYINSVTKWKDRIWLATNKGINFFDPESQDNTLPPPKIFFEEVTVNDSIYNIDDSLNLNFDQNDLYFKFTGISYRKQKDNPFYRYRLLSENADTTWYFTNNRDVRFNDLQAGKYTFEAAAQNKYGQWSEQPIIYHFIIQPHYTKTLWFRLLSLFAILGVIAYMIQTRSNRIRLREEQKRKLQEAELKTKDAELQALRNQMNPHFVFNALNSIQNFVFKNDAKKANYYLSRFSKLMRDGLQFARLKYISLKEEVIFLNTYLELEKMRFPDKFQYRIIVDEEIPTNKYFIPPLLFQPILENAVKHAFKNIDYEGMLEIHFEEKVPGELLKITITDNGDGFNIESVNKTTKSKNKSLGLEIISNQIALLNSEGKDRKASFQIFNRNTLDTQLRGTQVEFIISIKFSENG